MKNNIKNPYKFVKEISDFIALYDNYISDQGESGVLPVNSYLKIPSLRFVFVVNGNAEVEINGNTHVFTKGFSIALIKNSTVFFKKFSEDYRFFVIEVSDQLLLEAKRKLGLSLDILQLENKGYDFARIDHNQLEYVEGVYRNMIAWMNNRNHIFQKEILKCYANILIISNVKTISEQRVKIKYNKNAVSRQNVVFEHFINMLDQMSDEHRDVKFYADKLNVTPKYLSAITNQYTGKSAIACIEENVIKKIKNLMLEQKYSIHELCEIMNFSSQSFFGRYFKRNVGMSPREYINQHMNKGMMMA